MKSDHRLGSPTESPGFFHRTRYEERTTALSDRHHAFSKPANTDPAAIATGIAATPMRVGDGGLKGQALGYLTHNGAFRDSGPTSSRTSRASRLVTS